MGKRFVVSNFEKDTIREMYLNENSKEDRKFCHSGNVKSLDEIVGDGEAEDYIEGVQLRKKGIGGLVDNVELLKTLRLHPKISDGGVHLASMVMDFMKSMKPYNYYDETRKECSNAMDKIIELYKENEHGEELVKDIEKVYASHHLHPRAKEFMKHSLNMLKGK